MYFNFTCIMYLFFRFFVTYNVFVFPYFFYFFTERFLDLCYNRVFTVSEKERMFSLIRRFVMFSPVGDCITKDDVM